MSKSIMYFHPLVYEYGIRFLYWGGLKRLYSLVGENKSVFEPACGYGRVKNFIPASCQYSGIDLNKSFIEYGQKKGRDVQIGDVFNEGLYPQVDQIILCDILHHLSHQNMRNLIITATRFAREKIIIIEPAFTGIASSHNFFSKTLAFFFSIADADGINQIEHWMSEQEYNEFFTCVRSQKRVDTIEIFKHRFHYFAQVHLTS